MRSFASCDDFVLRASSGKQSFPILFNADPHLGNIEHGHRTLFHWPELRLTPLELAGSKLNCWTTSKIIPSEPRRGASCNNGPAEKGGVFSTFQYPLLLCWRRRATVTDTVVGLT
ncbi:hypothetical protein VTK56DRAFT_4217 [Thermocarpiscus australiensis]